MSNGVLGRLEAAERQLRVLERELAELRHLVHEPEAEPEPEPEPVRVPEPEPVRVVPAPAPAAAAVVRAPQVRVPELPSFDPSALLGGRVLAWAGGIVTLLGVVFFFVLAVDRGWIGPVERVGLGAAASALLLGGGVLARRRYGQLWSALAAAGAGVAGGYATLLAATALYGLLPELAALGLAAAIAAVGVALALAWRAQMLAGIGLVGAALVPFSLVFEGGVVAVGTAFAGLVLAGAAVVAVRSGWRPLLVAAAVAAVPQAVLLVVQQGPGAGAAVVLLPVAFAAILVASAVALERRSGLDRLSSGLLLASAALVGGTLPRALSGELWGAGRTGLALVGASLAYLAVGAALFRRSASRDASALAVALGLALGAIGLADLLAGATLAIAWAAQAAVLAWLGSRIGDSRYSLGALPYLALALGHAVAFGAPASDFLAVGGHSAAGVPALLAFVAAAAVFLHASRRWPQPPGGGVVRELLAELAALRTLWRGAVAATGIAAGVYALSLLVLAGADWSGVAHAGSWGHVAVTALWAAAAAVLLPLASRRAPAAAAVTGAALAGAAALKLVAFDLGSLGGSRGGWSAAAVGLAFLVAAWRAHGRQSPLEELHLPYALAFGSAAAGALAVAALTPLGSSFRGVGAGLLALALPYAALAALRLRRARDFATALWLIGVVLAVVAQRMVFADERAVAGGWAVLAAALAAAAVAAADRRLQLAASVTAGLAVTLAIGVAPPLDLFVAQPDPAAGVPALLAAVAALVAVLATAGRVRAAAADATDAAVEEVEPRARPVALVLAAALGLQAVSLLLLEGSQLLGGDLTAAFQRGQTTVSALWGLVGLVALHVGLTRGRDALKLAGFVLFGVALAKLFLFDLTALSSVTRALSFLAVGAVLLLAGFFYQRLSAAPDEEERARTA